MMQLFIKGGPIMWPIFILSIVTIGVVFERIAFLLIEARRRDPAAVQRIFGLVEHGKLAEAAESGEKTRDVIASILTEGLKHRETSLSEAMLEAASAELDHYNRGLVVLDTAVTLGPLLGLLGTVLGMIHAFGVVGTGEVATKQEVITGGISQCLIAVSFGLAVAIVAIIPLNYLNARMERARRQLESAMTRLELLVAKRRSPAKED